MTPARIETSSMDTGSSATMNSGWRTIARAIATRCRCPPLSSCGYRYNEVRRRSEFRVLERLRDQILPIRQGIRHAVNRQRLRDRIHHGEPRVERFVRILEDHLDASTEVLRGPPFRAAMSFAVEQELAFPWALRVSRGDGPSSSSASRLSDNPEDLAPF